MKFHSSSLVIWLTLSWFSEAHDNVRNTYVMQKILWLDSRGKFSIWSLLSSTEYLFPKSLFKVTQVYLEYMPWVCLSASLASSRGIRQPWYWRRIASYGSSCSSLNLSSTYSTRVRPSKAQGRNSLLKIPRKCLRMLRIKKNDHDTPKYFLSPRIRNVLPISSDWW